MRISTSKMTYYEDMTPRMKRRAISRMTYAQLFELHDLCARMMRASGGHDAQASWVMIDIGHELRNRDGAETVL